MCARTYTPRRPLSSTALTQYPTNICLFLFICKTNKKIPTRCTGRRFGFSHALHPVQRQHRLCLDALILSLPAVSLSLFTGSLKDNIFPGPCIAQDSESEILRRTGS